MHSDEGLANWLANIQKFGIGFVSGVPPTLKVSINLYQDTEALSNRISFLRETHYGKFWDFTADLSHGDLAYTNNPLGAHTDSTYFTDPVGLQIFHVIGMFNSNTRFFPLKTDHVGKSGESIYVDGFNAALQLKEKKKWAFDALSTLKISAHCAGTEGIYHTPAKNFSVISLNNGQMHQIRYNNDDRSPLNLPDPELFYGALKEFSDIVEQRDNVLEFKLEKGMVVCVDNWRVMHGRRGFTGKRVVCGGYIGHDDYMSRLRTILNPPKK